jgi:hypothetical protein
MNFSVSQIVPRACENGLSMNEPPQLPTAGLYSQGIGLFPKGLFPYLLPYDRLTPFPICHISLLFVSKSKYLCPEFFNFFLTQLKNRII